MTSLFKPFDHSLRPKILYKPSAHNTRLDTSGITVEKSDSDDDSQTFRFKAFKPQREILLAVLPDINATPKGKARFICCGAGAAVEYSPELNAYRVKSRTCGHRWCPACRRRFTAELRERLLLDLQGNDKYTLKFITLTLKSTANPLRDDVTEIFASFRRLRQTTLWIRRVLWGVAILEITLNVKTKLFHVHLHVIAKSGYIPKKSLSSAWKKATKGSFITDIRAIKNTIQAVAYATKYVSKGSDPQPLNEAGISAAEQINALYRKKTVLWFGKRPQPKEVEEITETDSKKIHWVYCGGFETILRAARAGVTSALTIITALESPP